LSHRPARPGAAGTPPPKEKAEMSSVLESRTVISPRAHQMREAVPTNTIDSLAGVTLGLFGNSKPNAALLLDMIAERIDQKVGLADVVRISKASPAGPAPEYVYDTLARRCQAVIFASADCGSCTTWGLHDVAELEKRGIPTLCMTGHPFVSLGEAYADSLGYAARMIVFEHPIAGKGDDVVADRADKALDEIFTSFATA
jgi:hypothetical protein